MKTFDNCALFVGVDDYSAFDESIGAPPGTSGLPGSRNDARWFLRVCRQLGIPVENLRILTSPRLAPEDLPGMPESAIGEATESGILAGVAWLAERLSGRDGPPGLFTYSGHGDWKEGEGLVLCPSDVTTRNLDKAIPLRKLQQIFAQHQALGNLTAVLDTCHSGVARGGRIALSLTGRAAPPELEGELPSLGERVLVATRAWGTAYQARFAGEYHGAFSWALASAVDLWGSHAEGSSVELDVSYGDLLARARALLSALAFDQSPALRGPSSVARMPVFHRGQSDTREATALAPNARRRGGQLTPDMRYTLAIPGINDTSWVVYVTAPGVASRYPMSTELWQIDDAFLAAMRDAAGGTTLTFTAQTFETPADAPPVDMPADSLWTQTAAPSGSLFLGENAAGQVVGVACDLRSGEPWGGTFTWYLATSESGPGQYAVGKQGITLRYGPASAYAGRTWYTMTFPPLSWHPVPATLGQTATGVALAQRAGSLCCAFTAQRDGAVRFYTSSDGRLWSSAASPGVQAEGAPALATLNDTLTLAYREPGGALGLCTYDTAWAPAASPSASTSAPPALGVVTTSSSSVLCLAYLDAASSSVRVIAWSGSSWSQPSGPDAVATGAPALTGFGDQLYLAITDTRSQTIAIFASSSVSSSGTSWPSTPSAVIRMDAAGYTVTSNPTASSGTTETLSQPGLTVSDGRLFLTFSDASHNVWICSSADGVSWSSFAQLSEQVAGVTSAFGAAPAAFGKGAFAVAYATSSDVAVLTTT